jgi:hypothetical protein
MASDEVDLQLGKSVMWNGNLGELAESCRHAVDHIPASDDSRNDIARAEHSAACFFAKLHAHSIHRHGANLSECQAVAVEDDYTV